MHSLHMVWITACFSQPISCLLHHGSCCSLGQVAINVFLSFNIYRLKIILFDGALFNPASDRQHCSFPTEHTAVQTSYSNPIQAFYCALLITYSQPFINMCIILICFMGSNNNDNKRAIRLAYCLYIDLELDVLITWLYNGWAAVLLMKVLNLTS